MTDRESIVRQSMKRIVEHAAYLPAVKVGATVFCARQVGRTVDLDVIAAPEAQFVAYRENPRVVLAEAGCMFEDVLDMTTYHVRMSAHMQVFRAVKDRIDAIAPADGDLRRRRLLGLPAGRPWCWLYRSADGRFVARMDGARLQVLAATPAAAIMTLRRCATDYHRVCQVALPHATSVPLVVPEPLAARPAADYRFFVACVRSARGFWDDASKLAEAARYYRRAQAQVVRAEP